MGEDAGEFTGECPSEEIGAYLDAELPPERVAALEAHFAQCPVCRDELNSQKAFLLELSRSLEHAASLELPKDFAKAVVTKAESGVTGLRKRSERIAALSIIAVLLLLVVIGFSGDPTLAYSDAAEPLGAIGVFLDLTAGLLHSVVFAFGFIVKKAFSGAAGSIILFMVITGVTALSYFIFKRYRRPAADAGWHE